MMHNGTLYFGMHRFRLDACDHGSGPLKATESRSGVRTTENAPFFSAGRPSRAIHVRRVLISMAIRSATSLTGQKFVFPPKTSSPSQDFGSGPFFVFGPLAFVLFLVLYFRGGAYT